MIQFYTIESIANAIYKAENSVKYPYGVRSINTHGDKDYARKICLNSIKNNYKRWIKAGKLEDFISFMARRYCPIQGKDLTNDEKKLNMYWVDNVKFFLKKEMKNGQK